MNTICYNLNFPTKFGFVSNICKNTLFQSLKKTYSSLDTYKLNRPCRLDWMFWPVSQTKSRQYFSYQVISAGFIWSFRQLASEESCNKEM